MERDAGKNLLAPCRDDPELFFDAISKGTAEQKKRNIERAKALCAQCAIETACLEQAIEQGETQGIWGGMTIDERRRHKMKKARP